VINLDSNNIDVIIPVNKVRRKIPFICLQNFSNWNLVKTLIDSTFMDFIELISS